MKYYLFCWIAVAMLFTACQKENICEDGMEAEGRLSVRVETLADAFRTRAGVPEVAGHHLRYILEVRKEANPEELVVRKVQATPAFNLNVPFGQNYSLLVWADYVTDGGEADLYYNTANLQQVEVILPRDFKGDDPARDAFCGMTTVQMEQEDATVSVSLTRPFAQLNMKASDLETAEVKPVWMEVTYAGYYTKYNVAATSCLEPKEVTVKYRIPEQALSEQANLMYDYVPASSSQQDVRNLTVTFYDAADQQIGSPRTITNVPFQRNCRTNISGNFFSNLSVNVVVDPGFQEDPASKTWQPGDLYDVAGVKGIVYKVNADGKSGKLLSLPETQSSWALTGENIDTGADDVTDGSVNRTAILNEADWTVNYPAFAWVEGLNAGGVTGWYLPARDELYELLDWFDTDKNGINTKIVEYGGEPLKYEGDVFYWSSTEDQGFQGNAVFRGYGNQDAGGYRGGKDKVNYVRAIRTF